MIRTRFSVRRVAAFCVMVFVGTTWGHHSHGNYEKAFVDLEGTVKEIHFLNPHSWIYIEITAESAAATVWGLESITPRALSRIGVTRDYLKPGDDIKVRCHQARDGSDSCLLGFVQAPDGSIKDWDGNRAKPEDDGFFDIRQKID